MTWCDRARGRRRLIKGPILRLASIASVILAAALAPASAADLWVSPFGTHTTISAALADATFGDRIKVETGTYFEHINLVDGVELRGGYAPGDTSEANRNLFANVTTIHGSTTGPPISSGPTVGESSIVDGFAIRGGGGSPGAAILVTGGAPVFRNNDISENRFPGIAGGAYVREGSNAAFENNVFNRNASSGSGGAIRVEQSTVRISGNYFYGNSAPNSGGAIYVSEGVIDCSLNTFRRSNSGDGGGGAIYMQRAPAGGSINGNNFEICRASRGGAIMVRDDTFIDIVNNKFEGCTAHRSAGEPGAGGAIAAFQFSQVLMQSNRISDCSADLQGGGVYAFNCTLEILGENATAAVSAALFDNCSANRGGAIYVKDCFGGTIADVRISNCRATSASVDSVAFHRPGKGGGIFLDASEFTVAENIIEGCTAQDGAGICIFASPGPTPVSFIQNNTFHGCRNTNSVDGSPGTILHQGPTPTQIAIIAGNIVSETLEGSCLRCRKSGSLGQASRPILDCSSFHNAAGNTAAVIAADTQITGTQCQSAFRGGLQNYASDGGPGGTFDYNGPTYCDTSTYRQRQCSSNQDLGSSCANALPSRSNRGVTDLTCGCLLVSLQESSWGQIKAKYR
jgi:predicted outer membrane repeat protein